MPPKTSGALGSLCANGSLIQRALVDGVCTICYRKVGLKKDGSVKAHVFQLARTDAKAKPHHNSAANRGMNAWLERGRK